MKLRSALVPVALVAALAFTTANEAQAAPLAPINGQAVLGPRIRLGAGIGINIPIRSRSVRRHRVAHASHVAAPAGYWRTYTERVWHPGELIGYDRLGHPIHSRGHYDYVERRVWVQAPRVVHHRRHHHPVRPIGHISVGLGSSWRIR